MFFSLCRRFLKKQPRLGTFLKQGHAILASGEFEPGAEGAVLRGPAGTARLAADLLVLPGCA